MLKEKPAPHRKLTRYEKAVLRDVVDDASRACCRAVERSMVGEEADRHQRTTIAASSIAAAAVRLDVGGIVAAILLVDMLMRILRLPFRVRQSRRLNTT